MAFKAGPSFTDIAATDVVQTVVTAGVYMLATRVAIRRPHARNHLVIWPRVTAHLACESTAQTKIRANVTVAANIQPTTRGTLWTML